MTFQVTAAFAGAFFLLALSPGPGLVAILSRCLGGGMCAGFGVTFGLIMGDAIFLAIAMVGLSAIANTLGPMFQVLKYSGAAYLVWLGIKAWRTADASIDIQRNPSPRILLKDVALGLMVTLGNPKPILFYGALLPAFMDLTTINMRDYLTLIAVVTAVSFLVYGGYMLLIERARRLLSGTTAIKCINQTTGAMLIGSGVLAATR